MLAASSISISPMELASNAAMQLGDEYLDITDPWQVLLWCRQWSLTKSQLEHAIGVTGPLITDLDRYFLRNVAIGSTKVMSTISASAA